MRNVFSFKGRTARQEWWLFRLGVGVPCSLIMMIVATFAQGDSPKSLMFGLVYLVLSLLLYLVYLPIDVRRCHDRDKSGTIAFVVFALELLSLLCGGLVGSMISAGYGLLVLICLGVLRGSCGPNKFGEDSVELRKKEPESTSILPWFAWIVLVCACLCGVVIALGRNATN